MGNPSFSKDYKSHTISIPAITFSDIITQYQIQYVDFVKIDIEGAELKVFSDMKSFLVNKQIGCVVFEVNPLTLEGFGRTVFDLFQFWKDIDYTLWRVDKRGFLQPLLKKWPDDQIGDCVALPRKEGKNP